MKFQRLKQREFFSSHERNAFTLTELLVVIAIISLLAALLFPVLARAKAAGQSAVCKNHLSQIGRAMQMYVSDYGAYPSVFASPQLQTWADRLKPYSPMDWTNAAWHCPTFLANKGLVEYEKPPPGGGRFVLSTSYSYNAYGIAGPLMFANHSNMFHMDTKLGLGFMPRSSPREQQIVSPSEMYAVADARPFWMPKSSAFEGREWMNPYSLTFGLVTGNQEASAPHSDAYNMLFLDSHVAPVKRKDYLFPPRSASHWNRDNQPHPEEWAPTNQWVIH